MSQRFNGMVWSRSRLGLLGLLGMSGVLGCGSDDPGPITKETQPAPILNTTDDSLKNFYGAGDDEFIDGAKKTKTAR